jgi:hypothetical protein
VAPDGRLALGGTTWPARDGFLAGGALVIRYGDHHGNGPGTGAAGQGRSPMMAAHVMCFVLGGCGPIALAGWLIMQGQPVQAAKGARDGPVRR